MVARYGPAQQTAVPHRRTSQSGDSSQAAAESTRDELSMRTAARPWVFPGAAGRASAVAAALTTVRHVAADPPSQQDEAVGPGDPQEPQVGRVPGEQPDEERDQAHREP